MLVYRLGDYLSNLIRFGKEMSFMKKITTIIELTLIAILSVAIVFTFFPQLHAPDWIATLYWAALPLLVIEIILNMIEKPNEQEMRTFSFYYGIYLLTLITFLPLIGGKIPTSNIFFVTIWVIFFFSLYRDFRKMRKEQH